MQFYCSLLLWPVVSVTVFIPHTRRLELRQKIQRFRRAHSLTTSWSSRGFCRSEGRWRRRPQPGLPLSPLGLPHSSGHLRPPGGGLSHTLNLEVENQIQSLKFLNLRETIWSIGTCNNKNQKKKKKVLLAGLQIREEHLCLLKWLKLINS